MANSADRRNNITLAKYRRGRDPLVSKVGHVMGFQRGLLPFGHGGVWGTAPNGASSVTRVIEGVATGES